MVEIVDIRHIHHVNVAVVESPQFLAPHPHVVNIDFIPQDIRDAMRGAWDADHFAPRLISIDKVFDVFVTAEGLVFTSDHRIIAQTVTQHSISEQENALGLVKSFSPVVLIDTSCVLMRKRGDNNYGHWLVEVLPKLALARSQCHVSGLAIPAIKGPMQSVIHDSLTLADKIGTTPRFELEANKVTFFKELILVSGATEHGSYMSPLMVREIDHMTANIEGIDMRRLFVSRRGAGRNLANQDVIERDLVRNGFFVMHPGEMNFISQVKAFKNAEIIVGVMGAGMTNIVFANSGAKVINLSPATMPDTFFYFLSIIKRHDYIELRGQNLNNTTSWDEQFTIDSNLINSKI